MNHRRHFIKIILGGFAGLGLIFSPLAAGIRLVWAKAKKIILPKGTRINPDATQVSFSGPEGNYEKSERFPMEDILSGKVFLAYRVNDQGLPRKAGFPLRIVAEGYYGGHWLKYVYKITAPKA